MSNLYNLTKELHTIIQEKAEKHGLKIEIIGDYGWHKLGDEYVYENTDAVQKLPDFVGLEAPQIRQILLAFKEVLGENPEYSHYFNATNRMIAIAVLNELEEQYKYMNGYGQAMIDTLPKTQAEALCEKWLDSLTPMFETNPEQVLIELLEVLKSI